MEIANFFWHGDLLRLQRSVIASFVHHGFEVNLWSYVGHQVPGARACDARAILPESDLFKYKYITKHTSESTASIAVFSDLFRYTLLSEQSGWWFDTDGFCLVNADKFKTLRETREIVAGAECVFEMSAFESVANGVLYMDKTHAAELLRRAKILCNQYNNVLPQWGIIGPKLLTNYINEKQLRSNVVSHGCFYAIHWDKPHYFFYAPHKQKCKDMTKDSFITHVWNSILDGQQFYDKNNPPQGSFLHELLDNNAYE